MIIVAGSLRVGPEGRSAHLQGCRAVVEQARAAPGCLDFSISADLVDDARINVDERGDSEGALARFRAPRDRLSVGATGVTGASRKDGRASSPAVVCVRNGRPVRPDPADLTSPPAG